MKTRNVRWGPCPFCKAEGWDVVGQRVSGAFDHDRPQGGRCLQSANHVSVYRAAVQADEAWSAELHRLFGKRAGDVRYTRQSEGEPGSELRRLYEDKLAADIALLDRKD